MKRASIINIAFLVAIFALANGCGKKSDTADNQNNQNNQATGTNANNAANNAANALSQAMGGAGGNAAHQSAAHSVPSATLASFLPSPSGYTGHEPSTSSANFNGIEWSVAERQFDNGNQHIKVTLADYNYAAGLTAAYSMLANFSSEDENSLQHGEKFGSYPGWVQWQKKSNNGQIGVIINDRIYLIIEGNGGPSLDDLRAVANSMNLDAIAKAAS
jgi:hypothetical protein